jgi:hypothetical protein
VWSLAGCVRAVCTNHNNIISTRAPTLVAGLVVFSGLQSCDAAIPSTSSSVSLAKRFDRCALPVA